MRPQPRSSWRHETGAELIEFALASSLLLMSIFGVLQGGYLVWRYNNLASLAQDGARYAAVRGTNSDSAMKAQGTTAVVRSYVQGRSLGAAPTVSVSADPNTLATGTSVTVTVSQPIARFTNYIPWSGTMTASATMTMLR